MIHSFLMIGQSNMAGRGFVNEVEPIVNERIKVLRAGRWQPMYVPVNGDRRTAGISLAESFADAYSKEHNVDVGLIPCADGGTNLMQWSVGGLLFTNAIYQAKLASRTSTIAGVLWHQGEFDCEVEQYTVYEEKCTEILNAFRNMLDLHDVPFLVGQLGEFLQDYQGWEHIRKNHPYVNEALKSMVRHNDMMGFVSSEGLKGNPDNLHFCSAALREFGLRYYEEFKKLERKDKVFEDKPLADAAILSELELL